MKNYGVIHLGYFENGSYTGNYIRIYSDGEFWVGERYLKDEKRGDRWTQYMTDGREKKLG